MRGVNRNFLKYVSIIAMLLDHFAAYFLPSNLVIYSILRMIGRLTAPIICYFLAEGYFHTRSKTKYLVRLLIFAVISQVPFMMVENINWTHLRLNILFTLVLSFMALWCFDSIRNPLLKALSILSLISLSILADWAVIAPIWVLIFHAFRNDRFHKFEYFTISILVYLGIIVISSILLEYQLSEYIFHIGMVIVVPILLLYNGSNGKHRISKWIFYIIYPFHLMMIALIKICIIK